MEEGFGSPKEMTFRRLNEMSKKKKHKHETTDEMIERVWRKMKYSPNNNCGPIYTRSNPYSFGNIFESLLESMNPFGEANSGE